jgi:pyruvate/2-oxoglutarate dehydrogenase complex dihydrolipoamide acyltransferase (E2) component
MRARRGTPKIAGVCTKEGGAMIIASESTFSPGTLEMWLRRPGDEICSGDVVAVVLTDDGAYELVSVRGDGGVIAELCVHVGERVEPRMELVRVFAPALA